jgi:hypothetical protein
MLEIRYTLLADGTSDRALIPLLTWLLRENLPGVPIQPEWSDVRSLPRPPQELGQRIVQTLDLYTCDLLFVHRDAERELHQTRVDEIRRAIITSYAQNSVPTVCVVPVRMSEAWLLFDEAAIRRASGNPMGRQPLQLPALNRLETLPDPKQVLHECLEIASGLGSRRLRRFSAHRSAQLVSEHIDDFSPLSVLPAFRALEDDLRQVIHAQGWATDN